MNQAQEQSEDNAASSTSQKRNCAEWITFMISSCILLALVGLILYDWLLSQQSPPILQVKTESVVEIREGQFYQPFVLENVGGSFAESVQVIASLSLHPPDDLEVGEQEISFLAAGEKKSGYFVFTHDPREGELNVRVASYR
ncbi:hypothetical protein PCC7418_2460 [Halothece sp. PCC 7418]|uniref:TIGR02588 family protein n=1 Tax=Halothece sp. (strain PCC 7418) TaxID=65093 RepID=UPI0002A07E5B|nr:TIGR02588 family protein [Halothece sp. PCC 7418]AFZ44607.1 hypothetical protein PCC7418_2460 [Halothece sp. PCC 7418]